MNKTKALGNSAIVLYFIIGLEIMIMISPFAGFFYSVFNPFLLTIAKYPATRWLGSFFLPHMVVPPDDLLKFVRVMGSVLFVLGIAIFFICAIQVYASKFLKKGTVLRGLYSVIRHPQYLGLGVAGLGLSVLWPRFLVPVLWLVMILLYYFLAKDEEGRMLRQYPDTYGDYMKKTGMFLPASLERILLPAGALAKSAVFGLIVALTIEGAFFLRHYTVTHLPLWGNAQVAALPIDSGDLMKLKHRMPEILQLPEVRSRLSEGEHYLVYFLPPNYIMQGLIADTGSDWKLYKHHHTVGMITDWIFHPFRHLTEGHHAMMHGAAGHPGQEMHAGVVRRLIFLKIEDTPTEAPYDLLSIGAKRTPQFMVDIEVHNMTLLSLKDLPKETGWGTVPTPVF